MEDINSLNQLKVLSVESIKLLEKHNLLDVLIQKEYIQILIKNIQIDADEVANIKQSFISQKKFANKEAFEKWLKDSDIAEEAFINTLIEPLKLAKYCNTNFSHKAQARFLKRKSNLDQVIYSLIRVRDPFLAKELYLRIKAKEVTFEDTANQYSEGLEKNSRGIIGPIEISKSHPVLANLLSKIKAGEVHGPIQLDEWWLIVRLESLQEATLNPQMEQEMSKELFNVWLAEETQLIKKQFFSQALSE